MASLHRQCQQQGEGSHFHTKVEGHKEEGRLFPKDVLPATDEDIFHEDFIPFFI